MKSINLIIILVVILTFSVSSSRAQCLASGIEIPKVAYTSTNNQHLKSIVDNQVQSLANYFGVSVKVLYYSDYPLNSIAVSANKNVEGINGTIYIGVNLMKKLIENANGGNSSVIGVLAHEFAHIMQVSQGCRLAQRDRELQADYLAGLYLFSKRLVPTKEVSSLLASWSELGDWSDPSHHGSPAERIKAITSAYNDSDLAPQVAYQISLNMAFLKRKAEANDDAEALLRIAASEGYKVEAIIHLRDKNVRQLMFVTDKLEVVYVCNSDIDECSTGIITVLGRAEEYKEPRFAHGKRYNVKISLLNNTLLLYGYLDASNSSGSAPLYNDAGQFVADFDLY